MHGDSEKAKGVDKKTVKPLTKKTFGPENLDPSPPFSWQTPMGPSKPYSNITSSGNSQAALVLGAGKGRKRDQEEILRPGKVEDREKAGPDGGGRMSEVGTRELQGGRQTCERVNPWVGCWEGMKGEVLSPPSYHGCLCLVACSSRPRSASSFLEVSCVAYKLRNGLGPHSSGLNPGSSSYRLCNLQQFIHPPIP